MIPYLVLHDIIRSLKPEQLVIIAPPVPSPDCAYLYLGLLLKELNIPVTYIRTKPSRRIFAAKVWLSGRRTRIRQIVSDVHTWSKYFQQCARDWLTKSTPTRVLALGFDNLTGLKPIPPELGGDFTHQELHVAIFGGHGANVSNILRYALKQRFRKLSVYNVLTFLGDRLGLYRLRSCQFRAVMMQWLQGEMFLHHGINCHDLFASIFSKATKSIYGPALIRNRTNMDRLISRTKPKLLLISSEPFPLQSIAMELAKLHHIKTLLVSHPFDYLHHGERQLPSGDITAQHYFITPTYLRVNPTHAAGFAHANIKVCKFLRHSGKHHQGDGARDPSELKAYHRPNLLFLAQGIPHEHLNLRLLANAMVLLKGVDLFIRPHPSFPHIDLTIFKRCPNNVFIVSNHQKSLHDAIASADVVLTHSSSTIYDAILAEKPILLINPISSFNYFFPKYMGMVLEASTAHDVVKKIRDILTGDPATQTLLHHTKHALKQHWPKPHAPLVRDVVQELLAHEARGH